MCGRFALWNPPGIISRYFKVSVPLDLSPRYNIAPGQQVLAIRQKADQPREAVRFKWGLIPEWARDASIGYNLINARAESVASKPAFKTAFKSQRCLIPASGFYEWKQESDSKQPFLIVPERDEIFALAGVFSTWPDPQANAEIASCAILTTEANSRLQPIHHRMPVIVDFNDYNKWLDPHIMDEAVLSPIMKPFPSELLTCYRVSSAVNDTRNENASVIEPVAEEGRLF